MFHILLIIGQLIGVIVLLGVCTFGVIYLWECRGNHLANRIVYVGSSVHEQGPLILALVRKYIEEKGENTEDYNLIEPGAGLAIMSTYLTANAKWKSSEAIEIGWVLNLMGRAQAVLKKSPITFYHQNIINYQPKKPAISYCYLSAQILTALFKQGFFADQLVISLTFAIEDCVPTEEILLQSWQKIIYVYDFRQNAATYRKEALLNSSKSQITKERP